MAGFHLIKARALTERIAMAAELLETRAGHWLNDTFPERQLYVRSGGRVQFFTLSTGLQAVAAVLALIFLGWAAFASVNVVFKDRIIAAKDRRYQEVQSAYEKHIADLQASYDALDGALVRTENVFQSSVDDFKAKQHIFKELLKRKTTVDRSLAKLQGPGSLPQDTPRDAPVLTDDTLRGDFVSGDNDYSGIELAANVDNVYDRDRSPAKKLNFLQSIMERLNSFFGRRTTEPTRPDIINRPAFSKLAIQIARVKRIDRVETALLELANRQITATAEHIDNVLHYVGVKPAIAESEGARHGIGGPFVPISQMRIVGISDSAFTQTMAAAIADERELEILFGVLRQIPLTTPVYGSSFHMSSGFGPRIDPFTHQLGFHPGFDFAGPVGALIYATAPGRVVQAGWDAGFGKMVQIDHGFGIRTGYGHMSSILVHVGMLVKRGTPIGRIGSTGRSTGPHVHYEIWVHNVPTNPGKFIAAGHEVDK